MPAIFKDTEATVKGAFKANAAALEITGGENNAPMLGALAQRVTFNYAQQVTRLYEIRTSPATSASSNTPANVYMVGGRTEGTAQLSRVIGPSACIVGLYENFGNICNAAKNDIKLSFSATDCTGNSSSGECNDTSIAYKLSGCVLNSIGASLQAQDVLVHEESTLMFTSLTYGPANAGGSGLQNAVGVAPGAVAEAALLA